MNFTKAVASGNDFIILDNRAGELGEIRELSELAKKLCARRLSIGADGLLVLEESDKADLKMRVFNPDGSEVTMCGNGVRCVARYVAKKNTNGGNLDIETLSGIVSAQVKNDTVKIKMTDPKDIKLNLNLGIGRNVTQVHFIDTGVPHVVHFTDDVNTYDVLDIGKKIRFHKNFAPDGTNADFVSVQGDDEIMVRTYERGVESETLACGTGVVASAVISHMVNGTKAPTKVVTKGGDVLNVYFKSHGMRVTETVLEGAARLVYDGRMMDYV